MVKANEEKADADQAEADRMAVADRSKKAEADRMFVLCVLCERVCVTRCPWTRVHTRTHINPDCVHWA